MKVDAKRRKLLALGAGAATGLLYGRSVWAKDVAGWPAREFHMTEESAAEAALASSTPKISSQVLVLGPYIAEDGAVVPIKIQTTLPDVSRITLYVPYNPYPLAAIFDIPPGTEPNISCRLKMNETSDVIALVETPKGVFKGSKNIKVTRGGCG